MSIPQPVVAALPGEKTAALDASVPVPVDATMPSPLLVSPVTNGPAWPTAGSPRRPLRLLAGRSIGAAAVTATIDRTKPAMEATNDPMLAPTPAPVISCLEAATSDPFPLALEAPDGLTLFGKLKFPACPTQAEANDSVVAIEETNEPVLVLVPAPITCPAPGMVSKPLPPAPEIPAGDMVCAALTLPICPIAAEPDDKTLAIKETKDAKPVLVPAPTICPATATVSDPFPLAPKTPDGPAICGVLTVLACPTAAAVVGPSGITLADVSAPLNPLADVPPALA
jgi:hypothetical protein